VSESVLRYQNREMAKADVAFEVLSRYFARQIIDILDATDPGDRELREREMRGPGAVLRHGHRRQGARRGDPLGAGTGRARPRPPAAPDGLPPSLAQAQFPTQPAEMKPPGLGAFPTSSTGAQPGEGEPAARSGPRPRRRARRQPTRPAAPGRPARLVEDARPRARRRRAHLQLPGGPRAHPRGLQKYHEEAVRTVHDSWLDREGEQSLRRWARSECARIWPHRSPRSRPRGEARPRRHPRPRRALRRAERLRAEEVERARRLREAGMQRLEPQGEVVLQRARQTQEAMRSVPTPELDVHETAAEDYRRFSHKLTSLYQTCLPYLRNSIGALWGTVGREPPQSFPDELPLVRELPPELLVIAATGSDELALVERSLGALDEEEAQLKKTKEELATKLARLEGELAATTMRDQEVSTDLDAARGLLEYVLTGQRQDELRAGLGEIEARKEQRVRVHGEAVSNVRRIEVGLAALEVEIEARTTELAALDEEHAALQKSEPLLFGKDEWRTKLRTLGEKRDERRAQLEQHVGAQNQLKIDLAAGQVAVQTAEAELGLAERLGLDVRAELAALEAAREVTGQKLGRLRPLRPLPTSEIEPLVSALEQKRAELAHTSERLKGEQRRAREDGVRVLARQKQIEQSRREGQARVESAKVAASEGMLAAQRRLASERREAVREHVSEVLGALERSLAQVGAVFVDPAREALLAATEPDFSKAELVREAGLSAAPCVEKLVRDRAPDLEAIDKLLAQIQTEFCDAAERACRAAWA
jgi:hypothetical protein